ncbi:type II toxin-antitoxin system VapC family toxin [Candidatus Woesearchaeota archaeon]|nr:type II toxin-antitoxin system VapC family toxin [Candidatus Woesearchaeota archaeon]
MRGNIHIKSRLDQIGSIPIHITVITLCELFKGAYLSPDIEKNLSLVNDLFDYFNILELDDNAARIYGERYSELKKIGKPTQDFDLLIASICISNNEVLITRNKKHFEKIKGLKIEEWS